MFAPDSLVVQSRHPRNAREIPSSRAKAALTGKASAGPARGKRISQDDIATFLRDNPGSLPARIAEALGVPVTNISAHLYRAKGERFERKGDGWHLVSRAGEDTRG